MSRSFQPAYYLLATLTVVLFVGGAKCGSPQLIFKNETTSSTNSLHSWSLDGEQVRSTVPIANSYYRDGISYDARAGQIYWASAKSIYRQRSDGTGQEIVVNSTGGFYGLAYDWVANNIYYTNYGSSGHIGVCSLRSRACAIIIDKLYYPLHIALHPQTRTLYWTTHDYNDYGYVYKASMDGSSAIKITEQLGYLQRITVDHQASKLYWAQSDTIVSSDIDGTNRKTALANTGWYIYGVAVDGDMLYWVESNGRIKADSKLNASSSVVPMFNGSYIDDIQILSLDNQPPLTTGNPCERHPCSHICVLAEVSYSCLCPSGFTLGSDGKTCKDLDAKIIYWSESGSTVQIQTLSLNSSVRTAIPMRHGRPGGLSYNARTAQIYWSFNYVQEHHSPYGDGRNREAACFYDRQVFDNGILPAKSPNNSKLAYTGGVSVRGIAVDWNATNIYYTDNVLSHIGICSFNTGSCSVLIKDGLNEPTDIAVYPGGSKIFWTDSGSRTIMAANMDGSSPHAAASADGQPYALSIDQESGLLFWVDSLTNKIRQMSVPSESQGSSWSLLSGVVALGVDACRGGVYWTEHYNNNGASAIKTARLSGGNFVSEKTLIDTASGDIWSNIQLVSLNGQPGV